MNDRRYSKDDMLRETARISWPELEPHFARGAVIGVAGELDLVEVATCFANDDRAAVQGWLDTGQVGPLDTATAKGWRRRDTGLWGVVVAPWVVVQDRAD